MKSGTCAQAEDVKELVYRRFGIRVSQSKEGYIREKLVRAASRRGCASVSEYLERADAGDQQGMEELIHIVTTGHTYFFRESDHFDFIVKEVASRRADGSLIWCAACSTGEEPYSLAMSLVGGGLVDFRILATDLDSEALRRFHQGLYRVERLEGMPDGFRRRFFREDGQGFARIDRGLRRFIAIKRLNLMDDFLLESPADFVLCRNVLIYFDEATRARAVDRLLANLKSGGFLFLGHVEPLMGEERRLERVGPSIYRKN
jgi:chemotaxis protein methyltransferase CheR